MSTAAIRHCSAIRIIIIADTIAKRPCYTRVIQTRLISVARAVKGMIRERERKSGGGGKKRKIDNRE